jgi:hypothetical protein
MAIDQEALGGRRSRGEPALGGHWHSLMGCG